jgi:DNA-binding CsgD family transcriptional regulator
VKVLRWIAWLRCCICCVWLCLPGFLLDPLKKYFCVRPILSSFVRRLCRNEVDDDDLVKDRLAKAFRWTVEFSCCESRPGSNMDNNLIDTIYEAAFLPELWPVALERIAGLSNSIGASITVFADGKPTRATALDSQREQLEEFLASVTLQSSTSCLRMRSVQPTSFVDINCLLTAEEIEADAVAAHYRPRGVGAQLGTAIPMPTGELVIVFQQRRVADGAYNRREIELLDGLRPHLARAGLMAARLGLERAQGAVVAMEAMGLPAAVLSSTGRVKATNALFEQMSSVFLPVAFGGVAICEPEANRLVQQVVVMAQSGEQPSVRSIPLLPRDDRPPMIIHILPLRRAAHDIFSGGDLLLAATTFNASSFVPSPNVLTGLFDLTPAEAKLAIALAGGGSLKQVAASNGIKISTARYYLEQVFQKTGTHQQSELVALLKSAQPFDLIRN